MRQKDLLTNVLSVLFLVVVLVQMVFTILIWRDVQILKGQSTMVPALLAESSSLFRNGEKMPAFLFTDLSGRVRRVDEWRGHPLLVIFASHECSACRKMYETLGTFLKRNPDLSVVIITTDSPERNQKFLEDHRLLDLETLTVGNIAETDWLALNIVATPTLVLVKADGVITNVWLGYGDALWLEIESAY